MRIGVIGPRGYPSMRIRGDTLAAATGWDRLDITRPIERHYDVLWMVKHRFRHGVSHVREHCDRLILDPLDWFLSPARGIDPVRCWTRVISDTGATDIVATSPASADCMRRGLPEGFQVHLIPHQADHRISADWYDPDGPVVYCGSRCFLGDPHPFDAACRKLGREFRFSMSQHHAWQNLKGAALQLCIRRPPHDGEWNRHHRPQIKIENSFAAGIPVMHNGHQAECSLHRGLVSWIPAVHPDLAGRIDLALQQDRPDPAECFTLEKYVAAAQEVVGCSAFSTSA